MLVLNKQQFSKFRKITIDKRQLYIQKLIKKFFKECNSKKLSYKTLHQTIYLEFLTLLYLNENSSSVIPERFESWQDKQTEKQLEQIFNNFLKQN